MSVAPYPVHVDATLDEQLSRWRWLVKWLLVIPHYVVLVFLWLAFLVLSAIAFLAILVTGRYPPSLFAFNVGVLRWSWRVAYYAYGALGTDRYPPFTLADVPDYPAHFDVDYPAQLSRGLALVKWWLLAIPHYLVVGVFVGGGAWGAWQADAHPGWTAGAGAPGLVGLLVLIAALALFFTGRYPRQLFDFVLGMNRWALRVAAYAALLTDAYPPFRLDLGGHEALDTAAPSTPPAVPPAVPGAATTATGPARAGWTAGRVVSLVAGSLLAVAALGLLGAGGVATWATNTQRDPAGYLTSGARTFATPSYALTSNGIDLGGATGWITPSDVLGTLRLRVTPTDGTKAVFVGVAPRSAVQAYLRGVSHAVVTDWLASTTREATAAGAPPRLAPAAAGIWTARVSGTGTQTLTWRPTGGTWDVVVMNPTSTAGLSVTADAGATVPDLSWIAAGLLVGGGLVLALALTLIAVPAIRAGR